MQPRNLFIQILFFLAIACPPLVLAEESRGLPKKKPDTITQPLTSHAQASLQLKQAIQEEQSGNTSIAIKKYRYITKNYIFSKEAPEAQFLLARLFQKKKQLQRAFDAFQQLIIRYPEAKPFNEAIAEQINIANFYLEKRPNTLDNLLMSNAEIAQHMYEKILASAPFGRYAPIVQFNLGVAYERQGRVQDAVQAYQALIDKYPNSSIVNNAQYQIAYVYMQVGLSKNSQDLSALLQAQDYFQDYALQYPNNERNIQIQKNLRKIESKESIDLYNIARFYDRNRKFQAAAVYYNDLILQHPSSSQATLAKTRLQAIRSEFGDDVLQIGSQKAETGRVGAIRRRSQAQVETKGLSDYAGPSNKDLTPDELPLAKPQMRTGERDIQPLQP